MIKNYVGSRPININWNYKCINIFLQIYLINRNLLAHRFK